MLSWADRDLGRTISFLQVSLRDNRIWRAVKRRRLAFYGEHRFRRTCFSIFCCTTNRHHLICILPTPFCHNFYLNTQHSLVFRLWRCTNPNLRLFVVLPGDKNICCLRLLLSFGCLLVRLNGFDCQRF